MIPGDLSPELVSRSLPEALNWPDRATADDLVRLPGCAAVYLMVDAHERAVLLATTQHLRRLCVSRLLDETREQRGRADLSAVVRGIRWRAVHCPFEARWRYFLLARELHPRAYRKLVSFGPSWFLHVNWDDTVPIVRVTERVWSEPGEFVGPWPSHRAAQESLELLWDSFDLCRYPDEVRRSPEGTRCAYAEMGRCDAPCDGAAPLAPYIERCRAAWRFVCGGAPEWIAEAGERMKKAAAEREFERAGLLKRQIALARRWADEWSGRIRSANDLIDLMVIPVTRRRAWKLFLHRNGDVVDGPVLPDRQLGAAAEAWAREQASRPAADVDATLRAEQAWLVGHFSFGRELQSAIVERLPAGQVPSDLAARLREAMERLRAKPLEAAAEAEAKAELDVPVDSDGGAP